MVFFSNLVVLIEDNIVPDIMGQYSHPVFCGMGKLFSIAPARSFHVEDMSGVISLLRNTSASRTLTSSSRYREISDISVPVP